MRSIDTGLYLRGADDDPELRIEERRDGTHVYIDAAPARSKVRDDASLVSSVTEAKPDDPRSGQQPATAGFVCDFRRSADGRWTGNVGGKKFRLQQSRDGSCFRVTEDRNPPWSVRVGDRALADPSRPLSANEEAAGLARWQQRLTDFWKRKDAA